LPSAAPKTVQPFKQPERPARNHVKAYLQWAGLRSFIFQAVLLGWTLFSLGVLGVLVNTADNKPRKQPAARQVSFMSPEEYAKKVYAAAARSGHDAQAEEAAIGTLVFWSFGGYLLVAVPLAIAAVATLEAGKK
jgi:hypothetical protein